MIRADDNGVMISGDTLKIILDLVMIIRSMRMVLTEDFGEEIADRLITDIGKLAYVDEHDKEALNKILEESELLEKEGEHNNGK